MRALWDVPAPAKLNLFLHITGRRDDGYHLLQSAFMLIDWCDTLHFERREGGALSREDLTTALPADDLILRAARALQQASGTRLGADIRLRKRIPLGGGLGGGSSDAATTLQFFDWAYKSGDKTADDLDYVAMPAAVKAQVAKSWGQITDAAGKPVALK